MELNHLIHNAARKLINTGKKVKSDKWQGIELKNPMHEAIRIYLGPAIIPKTQAVLANLTKPNLPWAEDHFKERVGGMPLNPGNEYKNWPFYGSDDKMRNVEQKGEENIPKIFSHTYMERFWPKYTGPQLGTTVANRGIRFEYGDLIDVINLLNKDPLTRQAYLPIFFPEDTGSVHGGRVPCTLGYLFMIRDNFLHVSYYIRSCDLLRHFKDDVYMACRLVQHIVLYLKTIDNKFSKLEPGSFDMHIGSLHIFSNELTRAKREFNITD